MERRAKTDLSLFVIEFCQLCFSAWPPGHLLAAIHLTCSILRVLIVVATMDVSRGRVERIEQTLYPIRTWHVRPRRVTAVLRVLGSVPVLLTLALCRFTVHPWVAVRRV